MPGSALFTTFSDYEFLHPHKVDEETRTYVYKARKSETNQIVALKAIEKVRRNEDVVNSARVGAQLQKELCDLDSYQVVKIFDYGDRADFLYVEMEYVEGEDLTGPIQEEQAVKIAIQICKILQSIQGWQRVIENSQKQGIVHCDLKPSNFRITSEGKVKLLDFGSAKPVSVSRRRTRGPFGTSAYLSPERIESGFADIHSELWAVGVILYELLTGDTPFKGKDDAEIERIIKERRLPGPPSGCSRPLQKVVLKMLYGPDQVKRYQSPAEFQSDLEAFQQKRETTADDLFPDPVSTHRTPRDQLGTDRQGTDNSTHRTPPSQPQAPQGGGAPDAGGSVQGAASRWTATKKVAFGASVFLLIVLISVGYEVMIWVQTNQLKKELSTGNEAVLGQVWDGYFRLSKRGYLHWGLSELRRSLKEKLASTADDVITKYRDNESVLPNIKEKDWSFALNRLDHVSRLDANDGSVNGWDFVRDGLDQADLLDANDSSVRARQLYCIGHLQRINARARKSENKTQEAAELFRRAIANFEEAARLKPDWPDPYLGLHWVYVNGPFDFNKAANALAQAERLGYSSGNREKFYQAECYRQRADSLYRKLGLVLGQSEEREQLQKVQQDYQHAFELYEAVKDAISVNDDIRNNLNRTLSEVQNKMKKIETRLAKMGVAAII